MEFVSKFEACHLWHMQVAEHRIDSVWYFLDSFYCFIATECLQDGDTTRIKHLGVQQESSGIVIDEQYEDISWVLLNCHGT